MATYHTVEQGEHISSIAMKYGFIDYRTIWDHPRNAELKQKRPDPFVLFPGDRVYIPEKQRKKEAVETGQRHRFKRSGQRLVLRMVIQNFDQQPIANTPCELEVEGETYQLTTDGNGQIERLISQSAQTGKLTILDLEVPVNIGHLDPVEEVSGQQARLNNLGYDAGEVGGTDEVKLRSAIEEFQCEHDLAVNGICGSETQAKLKEIHGC